MRIRRQFTVEGHSPYEDIAFRTVGLTLKLWLSDRQAGSFAFHAEDINS